MEPSTARWRPVVQHIHLNVTGGFCWYFFFFLLMFKYFCFNTLSCLIPILSATAFFCQDPNKKLTKKGQKINSLIWLNKYCSSYGTRLFLPIVTILTFKVTLIISKNVISITLVVNIFKSEQPMFSKILTNLNKNMPSECSSCPLAKLRSLKVRVNPSLSIAYIWC